MNKPFFMIQHRYNQRLLREDGKLVEMERFEQAKQFNSRKDASDWFEKTKVLPSPLKWSYFDIHEFTTHKS